MKNIFILLLGLLVYSYLGYPLLLWCLVKLKKAFSTRKKIVIDLDHLPEVILVIPAYNEKSFVDRKMQNTFDLNYPKNKLKVIWITDGSNDGSDEYIEKKYSKNAEGLDVKCYHLSERKGKTAAINRVVNKIETEIVIFCDANTYLNKESIVNLVRHFQDSRVACVAGEKRVLRRNSTAGDGESFYWKYESWVKKLNSEFHTCIGAVGELMAFRTSLIQDIIPEDTILDDFVISMEIAHKGYKVIYEPEAYAEELPSKNEQEEVKRKVRIAAGAFQSMVRYLNWLNLFKHPVLSFQYFSHKLTRWMIVPLCLPLIFVLNMILFFQDAANLFYKAILFLQIFFYMMIIIQHYANLSSKIFRIPYYVIMMNIAMYKGFWKYVNKQQSAVWEKVKREDVLE